MKSENSKKAEHLLIDIIVIAMSALICDADNWNQIEMVGKSKHDCFKIFLELPNYKTIES